MSYIIYLMPRCYVWYSLIKIMGLYIVSEVSLIMFRRFDTVHTRVTDRQRDRETDRDNIIAVAYTVPS